MNTQERRWTIAQKLMERHTVTVAELIEELNVSGMTIRRDLEQLERMGYARRVHGGAVHETRRSFEPPVVSRYIEQADEKRRIARAALSLFRSGESVSIDVGSTTMYLAELLRQSNDLRLIVVTPSLTIASELSDNSSYVVIATGGIVRRGERTATGDLAARVLQEFHVDKLFLAVAGMSSVAGLTEFNMEDAAVKKAMIASAKKVIALVDSSKFESRELCSVCSFEHIHMLITDAPPPAALQEVLARNNVEVLVAP